MKDVSFKTFIFDLDGVITKTARVHSNAWKATFDEYLKLREKRDSEPFKEFLNSDYLTYVDGKPRYKGVQSFLESRGIQIPFGNPSDLPPIETVCGIGNKKNIFFRDVLKRQGAEIYASSITFIKQIKSSGFRLGVASSSKNCRLILKYAGFEKLFETRVDGEISAKLGLKGKPEGDIFVKAAENLDSDPAECIVIEDASSGVKAGRNGRFGLVIGIARTKNKESLLKNGADVVVEDLKYIDLKWIKKWFLRKPAPLFENWNKQRIKVISPKLREKSLKQRILNPHYFLSCKQLIFNEKQSIFFIPFETLIEPQDNFTCKPEISTEIKMILKKMARKHITVIYSSKKREELEKSIDIKSIYYAGNYGIDIKTPDFAKIYAPARKFRPELIKIFKKLKKVLPSSENISLDNNKFNLSIHYHNTITQNISLIKPSIEKVLQQHPSFVLKDENSHFEIIPVIDWAKEKMISTFLRNLKLQWSKINIIYIANDMNDESIFRYIRTRGTGISTFETPSSSSADFQLKSPQEVKKLLEKIITIKKK